MIKQINKKYQNKTKGITHTHTNYTWAQGLLCSVLIYHWRTDCPFFSRSELQRASWLWLGFCFYFQFSVLEFCGAWTCTGLCTLPHSLWVQMCVSPVVSGRCCFLGVICHLLPWKSFWPQSLSLVPCPVMILCISYRLLPELLWCLVNWPWAIYY